MYCCIVLPIYKNHNKSYQGSNLHKPALLNTQYWAFRHLAPKLSVMREWANSHNLSRTWYIKKTKTKNKIILLNQVDKRMNQMRPW